MSWFPYPRGSCRLALQVLGAPRLGPVIPAGFGIGAVARYARRRSPRRHCSSPCSNSTHVRSTGDIQRVTREIQILKHVRHPNVVRLLEVIEKPRHIYLVTEFLAGGELFDFIVAHNRLHESQACHIFRQVRRRVSAGGVPFVRG